MFQEASHEFLTLPSDKEFDSRSMFSEAYSPPQQPGGGPTGDRTKPRTSRFRMARKRFRVKARATSFRFDLSEPADARILFWRLGKRVGTLRRSGLEVQCERTRSRSAGGSAAGS